ncbi:MAG: hypothetical protein J1E64_10970 [Acetatifactor sp.]|nr:hypothetical protein [Acetatifactor sp.]
MRVMQEEFDTLYECLMDTYIDWDRSKPKENSNWTVERYCKYNFGPIIGKYLEQDEQLFRIVSDEYSNEDILMIVKPDIDRNLAKFDSKTELDLCEKLENELYKKQQELLESGQIEEWLKNYFSPNFNTEYIKADENHIRGLCYVSYGYMAYRNKLTSIYNPDISNLQNLYKNIFGKNSQLHKYGLIEIDSQCELMAMNPPRFYDARIDKTINLSNMPKQLVDLLIDKKDLYDRISVRGSNANLHIYNGRYTLQTLMEAVEFGKIFSIKNLGIISGTKLYSADYNDALWVKIDSSNITFEELCAEELKFENSIVTQVLHLEYQGTDTDVIITHLDHEFVFYSESDYKDRKSNPGVKGKEQQRLKSFKIDGAKIPLNMPCEHSVNRAGTAQGEVEKVNEKVPFLIFVLKSYFKHTDLIDEYFQDLTSN